MTEYFAFDAGNGRTTGLIRRLRDDTAKTETLETVDDDGRWVDRPRLIRFFECFGGDQSDVVQLTEEQARERAAELAPLSRVRRCRG